MRVLLAPEARRQLDPLPTLIKVRVLNVFDRLKSWPNVSGAKPLRNKMAGQYRMRTGDYRVQFRIEGDSVVVTRIGHRDGFYDE